MQRHCSHTRGTKSIANTLLRILRTTALLGKFVGTSAVGAHLGDYYYINPIEIPIIFSFGLFSALMAISHAGGLPVSILQSFERSNK